MSSTSYTSLTLLHLLKNIKTEVVVDSKYYIAYSGAGEEAQAESSKLLPALLWCTLAL